MGAAIGLVGTAVSAAGTIAAANAQEQAAQAQAQMSLYQAELYQRKAMEERASAQRTAMEHRLEGRYAQSTLQARAAASGGTATDLTVLKLGEGIAGRTEYSALLEMSKGEGRARGLEDQSNLLEYQAEAQMAQAEAAKSAAMLSAAGTVIGGVAGAFGKSGGTATLPTATLGYG